MPQILFRSGRHTQEAVAVEPLNDGFTTYLAPDGQPLFSIAHPLEPGGVVVYRNRPTVPADLSLISVEQAVLDIANIPTQQGNPMSMMLRKLVISSLGTDRFTATQILDSTQLPGGNNNDRNPLNKMTQNGSLFPDGVQIVSRLVDPDAWFIITDHLYGLTFKNYKELYTTSDIRWENEDLRFAVRGRFSVGCPDPRGVYGNPGG